MKNQETKTKMTEQEKQKLMQLYPNAAPIPDGLQTVEELTEFLENDEDEAMKAFDEKHQAEANEK